MTIDEHVIECVLCVLENKRVCDRIYEIVNKSSVSKKATSIKLRTTVNRHNDISKYKLDNEHLHKKCTEQEEKIVRIESEKNELKNKNQQLSNQLNSLVQIRTIKEQIEEENIQLKNDNVVMKQKIQYQN